MSKIIDWRNNGLLISKHFAVWEVTNGDIRRIPKRGSIEEKNILIMSKELDKIRENWGSPIGVTSWYRPANINKQVGGVTNSQHILGSAVDIFNVHGNQEHFERWLDDFWGDRHLGYGVKSGRGFTHIDLREGRVRWMY